MKTIYISVFALIFSANLSSQTVSQEELTQFYEKQQTPFLETNGELFVLDNMAWQRPYGEKEFMLTPIIQDASAYYSRIRALDNPTMGIYKSIFSYIKVENNNLSLSLLKDMSINVPNYVQNEVIVFIPQIDIDKLSQDGVNFVYLTNYGKQQSQKFNLPNKKAALYFEGFESNILPESNFVDAVVGSNCGWKDVGCVANTGNYSAWCAGNGSACNAPCTNSNHVSNMFSSFSNYPAINTSGFVNMIFSFWMNFDLENSSGVTDYCNIYFDSGSGFQLAGTYDDQSTGDGTNSYVMKLFTISGFPNSITYRFIMVSDGSFNNKGVYLDDILLTGDVTSIDEISLANSISIYPNPTNGIFSIKAENMKRIEITSITGEIVKQFVVNKNKTTIDLTSFSSGIYFAKIITDKGSAIKKIVLN